MLIEQAKIPDHYFCKICGHCKYYIKLLNSDSEIINLQKSNTEIDCILKNENFGMYSCGNCLSINYWGSPHQIKVLQKLIEKRFSRNKGSDLTKLEKDINKVEKESIKFMLKIFSFLFLIIGFINILIYIIV